MDFSKTIINWYSEHKRNLPWRKTKNPYFIWLSEIILQQTQVKQGLPYYNRFVETFPTVFDLANAPEETVLKLWQGLGYYSRARNLHATSKYIAEALNGVFPNTFADLIKLKGVGDYTASAIASIAFGEPTAVVDGNVYRVLSRYFNIDTPINSTAGIKAFKTLATELIDHSQPATFNQAIMEFGARQCRPKNPDCMFCPLQTGCLAFNKGKVSDLPVKLKKTKVKQKFFNYLVLIDSKNKTLFEKRTGKGIWQNLYQFPLVETEQSLQPEDFSDIENNYSKLKQHTFDYSLYNTEDIVHKLSHQHLYTKFWILEIDGTLDNSIPLKQTLDYPVPVLISDFLERFVSKDKQDV